MPSCAVGLKNEMELELSAAHGRMGGTEKPGNALLDDVVASKSSHAKPGYSMPTITAILPEYTNAESEHLYHAFNQGSYTSLQALPEHLRCHEVSGPAYDQGTYYFGAWQAGLSQACGFGLDMDTMCGPAGLRWDGQLSHTTSREHPCFAEHGALGWMDRSIACGRR